MNPIKIIPFSTREAIRRAIFSRYSLTPDFQGGEWGDVVGVLPEHLDGYKQLTGISG